MRKNGNSENAFHRRVQKFFLPSKAVLNNTFLIYHYLLQKQMAMLNSAIYSQSANFALRSCTLNANKRAETARCAEFFWNQDTRCPAADLRHLMRYNGICAELRCLPHPEVTVKQTAEK